MFVMGWGGVKWVIEWWGVRLGHQGLRICQAVFCYDLRVFDCARTVKAGPGHYSIINHHNQPRTTPDTHTVCTQQQTDHLQLSPRAPTHSSAHQDVYVPWHGGEAAGGRPADEEGQQGSDVGVHPANACSALSVAVAPTALHSMPCASSMPLSLPLSPVTQYWSPSLLDFRLKPDWEAAAPLFERAALAYKVRCSAVSHQLLLPVSPDFKHTNTLLLCLPPPSAM